MIELDFFNLSLTKCKSIVFILIFGDPGAVSRVAGTSYSERSPAKIPATRLTVPGPRRMIYFKMGE